MTSSSDNPMDVLNALMEERSRYEQWLAQLDARKGTTPPHVYDRVRTDYGERLRRVLEQLGGRASELQVTATTLADRVAALYADETGLRDERAEAELRAAVGEYTQERAREVMDRCDEAIATLGSERASVGAELARVQEILSVASRANTPPTVDAQVVPIEALAPAPTPPGTRAVTSTTPQPPAPAASRPQRAEPPSAGAFDELAFLQSVVDKPVGATASGRPADLAPEPSRDTLGQPDVRPSLGRVGMLVEATSELGTQPSGQRPARGVAPTPVLTSAPLVSKDGQEPSPSLTPGSIPAFLKDMPTEQIKTLKCQECGTMNYPTEWYCERCGGELAAM